MAGKSGRSVGGRWRLSTRRPKATRLRIESLESRALLSINIDPSLKGSPDDRLEVVIQPQSPDPAGTSLSVTIAADSAPITSSEQTVLFDPATRTVHVGAPLAAIDPSMDDVEAILQQAGYAGITQFLSAIGPSPAANSGNSAALPEPLLGAGTVHGDDDRVPVGDTLAYPFSTVGRVDITFSDGSTFMGSGAIISPYHFLTAGHNVFDSSHGGWATGLDVSLAQDGVTKHYGTADWLQVRSYTGWTNSADPDHDWAVITLDRQLGNFSGWLGYEWRGADSDYDGMLLNTAGYPGDLGGDSMYLASGTTDHATANRIFYSGLAGLDTAGGQSGSSVWRYDGAERYVNAVHAYGGDTYNSGTRINEAKFNSLQSWISEDNAAGAPTDRPDLVDYDQWFQTEFAGYSDSDPEIGQSFNVWSYPYNMGTADAGAFTVRYRLSTDTFYDVDDTLLGDIGVAFDDAFEANLANLPANFPNVPTGSYYVVWSIDPFGEVGEFVESNNFGHIAAPLTVNGVSGDRFEPNDSFASATDFGSLGSRFEAELSIHVSGNADYFRFTAAGDSLATVDLAFSHALGDVDVGVYDSGFNQIGVSAGVSDTEHVQFNALAGQTYYVHVYGYAGATNPEYSLDIQAVVLDRFEPNNSFAAATDFGFVEYREEPGLSIHASGDQDYFKFFAEGTGTATLDLSFVHALGDVDVRVYNDSQQSIGGSFSVSDHEHVEFPVEAGRAYYINVYGYGGSDNPDYLLVLNSPPSGPDRFEENESFEQATNLGLLGVIDEAHLNIHTSSDADYFTFAAAATGGATIDLQFAHSYGDIDLFVYDSNHSLVASSTSVDDDEQVQLPVVAGATYFILVQGYAGATNPDYRLLATGPAEIRGYKWDDRNGNAAWDSGEPGLENWTVYLDLDSDGEFDPDEPSTQTTPDDPTTIGIDETGSYVFSNLAPGTYTVGEVQHEDWIQTYPFDLPDLRGTSLDIEPDAAAAGDIISADFSIENIGTGSAAGFDIGFYLSRNQNIDPFTDRLLTYLGDPVTLGADQSFGSSINLQLPALEDDYWTGDGTYYIGMFVDDVFETVEFDETNNRNRGLGVDLAAIQVSGTSDSEFSITLNFTGGLTADQEQVFAEAAARWSQVIIGDVPDVDLPGFGLVDDVVIDASGVPIDGVGGILGQAGPDWLRGDSFLPISGTMQFDSADILNLEAAGQFDEVIMHEMGHVLGVGTIWTSLGLLAGGGGSDPRFTGPLATAEYQSIFGSGDSSVPVENTGGGGTRDSHWRESVFDNELMTGFLNSGVANPLSRVTAASLGDLGYVVNIDAADDYTAPTGTTTTGDVVSGRILALSGPYKTIDVEKTTTSHESQDPANERIARERRLAIAGITTTASEAPVHIQGEPVATPQVGASTAESLDLINMDGFRADPRFAGINGQGFSTVILDTGIDLNHPFFGPDDNNDGISDGIVFQYDFTGTNDNDASDGNSHGSNVASIVGSRDSVYGGVAPATGIIALKVLSDSGGGTFADLEEALQWVVANAATYNIASVNMSLGDSGNYDAALTAYGMGDELAALAAMNVLVVSAAGNAYGFYGGAQGVSYPAADPNSLAVSAVWDGDNGDNYFWGGGTVDYTTGADRITSFSQRHTSLTDIAAPGAMITGADSFGGIISYAGTSQASPHIAGIATLAQQIATEQLGRRLTLSEFATVLRSSAVTIFDGDDEDDNVINTMQSFPRVEMLALGEAILALGPPPSGSHRVDLAAGQILTDVNFGNQRVAGAPRVGQVFVSSDNWSPDFLAALSDQGLGDATYGFAIKSGPSQTETIPWTNVNQISVRFDQPVNVAFDDLSVLGLNEGVYDLDPTFNGTGVLYDPVTFTATWKLAATDVAFFGGEIAALELDGSVDGLSGAVGGLLLDGEWTDSVSEYPAGDGVAGGDFVMHVDFLPGDVNRDTVVSLGDVISTRNRTSSGVADSLYSVRADVNGDGFVSLQDVISVRNRNLLVLPNTETVVESSETSSAIVPAAEQVTPVTKSAAGVPRLLRAAATDVALTRYLVQGLLYHELDSSLVDDWLENHVNTRPRARARS